MKLKSFFLFSLLASALMFSTQGCDKCTETGEITFDASQQNLSITYIDTAGRNYIDSIYNVFNCSVAFNDQGGNGQFVNFSEDFSDGKFGPFAYTTKPTTAKMGLLHDYVFICTKDTFGSDTFRVKFYPTVDECHEYWGSIEYYQNGELLGQYSGQESVAITIQE